MKNEEDNKRRTIEISWKNRKTIRRERSTNEVSRITKVCFQKNWKTTAEKKIENILKCGG